MPCAGQRLAGMVTDGAAILVLNAGSSSLKFALFTAAAGGPAVRVRGSVDGIGRRADARLAYADLPGLAPPAVAERLDHDGALDAVLDWLDTALGTTPDAAGHRVVHGGRDHVEPVVVTPQILDRLATLEPFAPHHQPHNLAGIRRLGRRLPGLPQVACFDTAFHAGQPAVARRFGLPRALEAKGLIRYGFHGLSYEYVVRAFAEVTGMALPRRLVVAHLGNGASMAAVLAGRGVATTMGFSTLDGLVMGTRSGAIDPGVLLHLMRAEGMDEAALTDLLYNRSGLLGTSGISADMATLLASDDPRAAAAVELYCYRIDRELGSLAAALGGLDALVFTGGIGENAAPVRAAVARQAAWLGIDLDPAANTAGAVRISTANSATSAWVVPTDEEQTIARHVIARVAATGA